MKTPPVGLVVPVRTSMAIETAGLWIVLIRIQFVLAELQLSKVLIINFIEYRPVARLFKRGVHVCMGLITIMYSQQGLGC